MRVLLFSICVSLITLLAACNGNPDHDDRNTTTWTENEEVYKRAGRMLTGLMLQGKTDSLEQLMSSDLISDKAGMNGLQSWVDENAETPDREITVSPSDSNSSVFLERTYRERDEVYYCQIRRMPAESSMIKVIRWRWNTGDELILNDAKISTVNRSAKDQKSEYNFKTQLQLPFQGEWYTSWGGRNVCENYHVVLPYGNRFAYDFIIRENGKKYEGDGTKNEDYYCFGKDILAPASGQIVTAIDSVRDNTTPGEFDATIPNTVIIDHGNSEYSFLGHLKYKSVPVQVGDQVAQGQKIGECGNSGTSGSPHLHYQVQTKPEIARDAEGLPAPFSDYYTEDKHVQKGMPQRGQYVRSTNDE